MTEQPTATLTYARSWDGWCLTFHSNEPRRAHGHPHRNYRTFRGRNSRHLAVQFASRRGIRIEGEGR